ncbi:unnamed protein product [Sphagnum balticum]
MGVKVVMSTRNIVTLADTNRLIADTRDQLGSIGGIFHLAVVLHDCLFESQTVDNFKESAATKYWGTKNLDAATRKLCGDELKWSVGLKGFTNIIFFYSRFVVFSSVTAGRGNAGQTNYGWANSAMERVVEQRRHDGYAGVAVEWGAIGDAGLIMTMGDNETGTGSGNGKGDVVQTIAHILGVQDVKQLDFNASLGDLGLDSLMGVEIKQALERDYDVVLSMKDIRTAPIAMDDKTVDMVELERQMTSLFTLRIDMADLLTTEQIAKINDVHTGPPVFFVHSIEGIATPLRKLALSLPSDSSIGSSDDEDDERPVREYKEKVHFEFAGEEFRRRYRLSSAAAEDVLGQIGPLLVPRRGAGVRSADLLPKQKLIVCLKLVGAHLYVRARAQIHRRRRTLWHNCRRFWHWRTRYVRCCA